MDVLLFPRWEWQIGSPAQALFEVGSRGKRRLNPRPPDRTRAKDWAKCRTRARG